MEMSISWKMIPYMEDLEIEQMIPNRGPLITIFDYRHSSHMFEILEMTMNPKNEGKHRNDFVYIFVYCFWLLEAFVQFWLK